MHLRLLLFWNTTDGKGAHCMFRVATMTFLCIDPPPPPRCQLLTVIKNLLSQHCRGNLLLRIRLVLVFHRVLQLQRANNIQFREWHFVSVALVWRGIQLWNRTQPNSKNADFFPNSINHSENNIVSKLYALSEFHYWLLSNLAQVRQAASKTKLLTEKRKRKYFIVSLTTFSCVIQHSVAKQMLWSKSYQLLLFSEGTVWEHKPFLLLTKSLRWTSRISVLFIVMSCYHENECFQFMLRALSAVC